MFIGHFAVGFYLKSKARDIPLWLLFLSVQFVDFLSFILVLMGIERGQYRENENPFLRIVIEYIPYSHSLFTNLIFALLVFLAFWRLKNKTWGFVLSVGLLSHWFLDVISHTADIPIFFDQYKIGFGLWKMPWTSFISELLLLVLAGYAFVKGLSKISCPITLIILLVAGFVAMFFSPYKELSPTSVSLYTLGLFSIYTLVAYWCDRQQKF